MKRRKFQIEPICTGKEFDNYGYMVIGWSFNTLIDNDEDRERYRELKELSTLINKLEFEALLDAEPNVLLKIEMSRKIFLGTVRKLIMDE